MKAMNTHFLQVPLCDLTDYACLHWWDGHIHNLPVLRRVKYARFTSYH